ncbi:MAG: hypothetical protein OXT09_37400 [Myxococcales bacterium]|nr:hypothetical protein [Myxococcales bacterium]
MRSIQWFVLLGLLAACNSLDSSDAAGAGASHAAADDIDTILDAPVPGQDVAAGLRCRPANPDGSPALRIDTVDMLFVIDNGVTMAEEQAALAAQFPRMLEALTTGDLDGDGEAEATPAEDVHLGVVTTDMGLVGIQGVPGCANLGDDGVLNDAPDTELLEGCQSAYPPFLVFQPEIHDLPQTAQDLACLATVGTDGCLFKQPLEAGLKALWPSVDRDPETGQAFEPNRILFLGDIDGVGQLGHGDAQNAGFLRSDPTGLSLVSIVVVTNEEDCSSADTAHFTPNQFLDPEEPLAAQDMALRCFFNPQNLYSLDRYINGFQALRPGNEHLVHFGAIVGVPPDLVDADARAAVDFDSQRQRDAYYDAVLADLRMQERVDPIRTDEGGPALTPACEGEAGGAEPGRRFVTLARRFGAQGSIGSICDEDLGPAIDGILQTVSAGIGQVCLP